MSFTSPPSGELEYYNALEPAALEHALAKPWSDDDRGRVITQLGAILCLLPSPPAKVLEIGCGTGWLTWLLQSCGYDATGVDPAPRAIELASLPRNLTPVTAGQRSAPTFVASPAETLPFEAEFDVAIFFDALHHVTDVNQTLNSVANALKPGGLLLTSEPGRGHAAASQATVERFGVIERDMPVEVIRAAGEQAGFEYVATYCRADALAAHLYHPTDSSSSQQSRVASILSRLKRAAKVIAAIEVRSRDNGILILRRPSA